MNTTNAQAREQLAKLAEALYRFSSSVDSSFSTYLKQIAVELAGALGAADDAAIAGTLARAEGVLSLGEKIGAIAAKDVQVIAAAIQRSQGLALPVPAKDAPSVEVFAEIAAQESAVTKIEEAQQAFADVAPERVAVVQKPVPVAEIRHEVREIAPAPIANGSLSASERQARIIAVIRQNPTARMRDLLAALPGVSERTIRYDIERLVGSGMVEREGVGGPATWYRVRDSVTR